MTCPHLQDGRCALAELLARKALGAELACAVTDDQCGKCLAYGIATEEKPTLQVTAAVTRVCGLDQRRAWGAFASRLHLGPAEKPQEVDHPRPARAQPSITGQRRPPQPPGPGTCLARILKDEYGVQEEAGCACTSRMDEMNAKGVDWCEANVEKIVDWMLDEVDRRKLWQRVLPNKVKRWKLRQIARRAITNCRQGVAGS